MVKKLSLGETVLRVAIILLVVVVLYCGVRIADGLLSEEEGPEILPPTQVITYNGVEYYPRQDIVVIMVAGIDENGPVKDSGSYNNPGEADMVTLVILDTTNKKMDLLTLNRDTMVDMPVLGVDGKQAGTYHGQLALSHTYGSGLSAAAENLKTTVSQLLYKLDIDYYVTMNMDAIGILNDQVGGVTVQVEDDFSQVDSTIGTGTVKLNGQQAITFLRSRQGVGNQLNLSRMQRQEIYMTAFVKELKNRLQNQDNFATNTYDMVSPYMVTDLSSSALLGLVEYYSDYKLGETYRLEGENKVGEFMEYHLDQDALNQRILELFYRER